MINRFLFGLTSLVLLIVVSCSGGSSLSGNVYGGSDNNSNISPDNNFNTDSKPLQHYDLNLRIVDANNVGVPNATVLFGKTTYTSGEGGNLTISGLVIDNYNISIRLPDGTLKSMLFFFDGKSTRQDMVVDAGSQFRLLNTNPILGSLDASTGVKVQLEFNKLLSVDVLNINKTRDYMIYSPDAGKISIKLLNTEEPPVSPYKYEITTNYELLKSRIYTLILFKNLVAQDGSSLGVESHLVFTTSKNDTTAPIQRSVAPGFNEQNVATNQKLIWELSEPINADSVKTINLVSNPAIDGSLSVKDNTITFRPKTSWQSNTLYEISLTKVTDTSDNVMPELGLSAKFKTGKKTTSIIYTEPSWSSLSDLIAFTSNFEGINAIYVCKSDGTELKRISSLDYECSQPTISYDGNYVAYTSTRNSNTDIYRSTVISGFETRLTTDAAVDEWPNFSRIASNEIIFNTDRGNPGHPTLYQMNLDGSGQLMIDMPWTSYASRGKHVPFTDSALLFETEVSGKKHIVRLIDRYFGGNPYITNITNNRILDAFQVSVSPDTTIMCFISNQSGSSNIWLSNSDGSGARQLTFESKTISFPIYSPIANDNRILAVTQTDTGSELWFFKTSNGDRLEQLIK